MNSDKMWAGDRLAQIATAIVISFFLFVIGLIVYEKIQSESALASKKPYETRIYDGCEYIRIGWGGTYVHKGNCTNSIHYKN